MSLPNLIKPKHNYELIRIGKNNDGGYLVGTNTVNKTGNLISFGISDDWSFEENFFNINKNINIYAFDNVLDKNWLFKKFIKNLIRFFLLKISFKELKISLINVFKINYLKKKLNLVKKNISYNDVLVFANKKNIFFKIDIEGSEYRILDEIVQIQDQLTGLVIEFHDIDLHQKKIENFIKNINLEITHIHPNNYSLPDKNGNPTTIELTFEKNPLKKNDLPLNLPNELDQKCDPKSEEYKINFYE